MAQAVAPPRKTLDLARYIRRERPVRPVSRRDPDSIFYAATCPTSYVPVGLSGPDVIPCPALGDPATFPVPDEDERSVSSCCTRRRSRDSSVHRVCLRYRSCRPTWGVRGRPLCCTGGPACGVVQGSVVAGRREGSPEARLAQHAGAVPMTTLPVFAFRHYRQFDVFLQRVEVPRRSYRRRHVA